MLHIGGCIFVCLLFFEYSSYYHRAFHSHDSGIFSESYCAKVDSGSGKIHAFVFSTLECGTIGYPLIAMLFGQQGTSAMELIDVTDTIFLFIIAVPLLQVTDGQSMIMARKCQREKVEICLPDTLKNVS